MPQSVLLSLICASRFGSRCSSLARSQFGAAGLGRRSIFDLAFGYDKNGNEIYIESQCGSTGKPIVWYQIDRKGTTRRYQRGTFGIQVEHMNTGPFL